MCNNKLSIGMIKESILLLLFVLILSSCTPPQRNLPYLGKHQTKIRVLDGKEVIDTLYHKIPDFSFMDQDSQIITQKDIEGKITVVAFIFTSCPSICPLMTTQLKRIQMMTSDIKNFQILTYSVDPKRDTPQKLKEYANEYKADTQNWRFLTGDAHETYTLGMIGYYLSMGKDVTSPGGFIHSPRFVLVDQQKHIRGMYDGTKSNETVQLVEDIKLLSNLKNID